MIEVDAAAYQYGDGPRIGPISVQVAPGERVWLSGPSGAGKTTLLRLWSGVCARSGWGRTTGRVSIDGADPALLTPAERPGRLGFVGQDPGDQLVCGTIDDELGFGPECAGRPADEVEAAIARERSRGGLDGLGARDPRAVSAGQQQRVVTAAALAGGARVVLLDEPLAHLDPAGADALLAHLRRLADAGIAVVVAEHRGAKVAPWATRELALERGLVAYDGPPRTPEPPTYPARAGSVGARVARTTVDARYGARVVLDGLELELFAGDRVAVLGPNGAGKSTLLGRLSGRIGGRSAPLPGAVEIPHDPDLTLFCPTVRAELAYGARERGLPEVDARVESLARALGLAPELDRPPHALSRGQRLRVAVGAALAASPPVLLLDEPTAGQDPESVARLLAAIDAQLGDGALVFATHDEGLARAWATRVIHLEPRPAPEGQPAVAPRADPRVGLWLSLAVGGFAVILDQPRSLLALTAASVAGLLWARIPARRRAAVLGAAALVMASTAWTQGLFYAGVPRTEAFAVGPLVWWREGLVHGVVQSLRLVATGIAGLAVALSTPVDRLFAALIAARVPHGAAFLAVTALRFVPVVAEEWATVRFARARRGRPLFPRAPWDAFRQEMGMLAPLLARTIRRSRVLAESLDLRGFDPQRPRRARVALRASAVERASVAVAWLALGTLAAAAALTVSYTHGGWWTPALRPLYGWVRAWL